MSFWTFGPTELRLLLCLGNLALFWRPVVWLFGRQFRLFDIGGAIGIALGFGCAVALRSLTSFPASVQTWVAIMGLVISSTIGLFFGIYPARKAANLDPVAALRTEVG